MRKEMKEKTGKRKRGEGNGWKNVLVGVVAAVLIAVGLLGLCAVLISAAVVPGGVEEGCVLIACAAGTFVGGWLVIGGKKAGGLLRGVGVGFMMSVVLGVSGILLYGGLNVACCAAVSGACLCGGGLAGVLGGGKRYRGR